MTWQVSLTLLGEGMAQRSCHSIRRRAGPGASLCSFLVSCCPWRRLLLHICIADSFDVYWEFFFPYLCTDTFHCRMMFYFSSLGYIHVIWEEALGKLALVALAATVVECIPVTEVVDDNISVPLATMLVAFLLFSSNAQWLINTTSTSRLFELSCNASKFPLLISSIKHK